MGFLDSLVTWTQETFLPLGELGLFALAFMESSFFPVPPDLLLIPLVLLNREAGLWLALIATLGSTLGSIFGYYLGKKGGRKLLRKFASEQRVKKLDEMFEKHGVFAVGAAAFSPIPYKVFTISAGTFNLKLWKLVVVSFICRGARFFPEAIIIMLYGQQLIGIIKDYFNLISLIIVLIVGVFYFWYNSKKKRELLYLN